MYTFYSSMTNAVGFFLQERKNEGAEGVARAVVEIVGGLGEIESDKEDGGD